MIEISIDTEFEGLTPPEPLRQAAQAALEHQQAPESALTIVLSGDEHLQRLNLEYLGIDAPTDVLSFPAGQTDPETGQPYLGDILISCPKAQAQAGAAGHPLQEELQLLVVHGVLHLLGFDHAGDDDKAAMWQAQDAILESLGVSARPT